MSLEVSDQSVADIVAWTTSNGIDPANLRADTVDFGPHGKIIELRDPVTGLTLTVAAR